MRRRKQWIPTGHDRRTLSFLFFSFSVHSGVEHLFPLLDPASCSTPSPVFKRLSLSISSPPATNTKHMHMISKAAYTTHTRTCAPNDPPHRPCRRLLLPPGRTRARQPAVRKEGVDGSVQCLPRPLPALLRARHQPLDVVPQKAVAGPAQLQLLGSPRRGCSPPGGCRGQRSRGRARPPRRRSARSKSFRR